MQCYSELTPPTAVTHSLFVNLVSSHSNNLVVAKSSLLQVFTSKTVAGAPQYTLRIRDCKTDAITDPEAFVFKPPSGANKVDLDSLAMAEFDELPPGIPSGAKK